LAWFAIVYPIILSLLIFRFYGPAFFFLYLSRVVALEKL